MGRRGAGGPTRLLALPEPQCRELMCRGLFGTSAQALGMLLLSLLPADFGCDGAAVKGCPSLLGDECGCHGEEDGATQGLHGGFRSWWELAPVPPTPGKALPAPTG